MKPKEIKDFKPNGKDVWVYERKMDGSRHLFVSGTLWSKRGVERNNRFEHIVKELNKLPECVVLDCEIYVEGGTVLDLNSKMNWSSAKCCVFDILKVEGKDIINESFAVRNQVLKDLLKEHNVDTKLIHTPEFWMRKDEAWKEVIDRNLEGVIAKRLMSKYHCGKRSPEWVKIKRKLCADVEIIGHEEGSTKGTFICKTDKGVPVRVSGTSVDIVNFWKQNKPKKMEVSYMYETPKGLYFQPVFEKFIED